MGVLLMACLIAMFKISSMVALSSTTLLDSVGFVWTSFNAFFGGIPSETSIDNKRTYKLTVFISLLSGLIIWIAYQSSLTSELAVVREILPFSDLEGLAKSSWKIALPSKSSSVSQPFLDPLADSVYSRILANNIDENSFDNTIHAREERLMVESNTAVYSPPSHIKGTNAYSNCKVRKVVQI